MDRRAFLLGAAALLAPRRAYSFVGGWQQSGALWLPPKGARILVEFETIVDELRITTRVVNMPLPPFYDPELGLNVFP